MFLEKQTHETLPSVAVLIPQTFAEVPAPEVIAHLKDSILGQFSVAVAELPTVNAEYSALSEIELTLESVTPELEKRAKELRKIVVGIEKEIDEVHRDAKRAFLESGRYVDALKRTGIAQTEQIKELCDKIKDFRKNEEIKAYNALTQSRTELIFQALYPNLKESQTNLLFEINSACFYVPAGLGGLTELQFDQLLKNAESLREMNEYKAAKAAEAEAERLRVEAEKEAENERLRAENAEKDRLHAEKIKLYKARSEALVRGGVQEIPADLAELPEPEYVLFVEKKLKEAAEKKAEKERKDMLLSRYQTLLRRGWVQTQDKNYEKHGKIITRGVFLETDPVDFIILLQNLENEISEEFAAKEAERIKQEAEMVEKERIELEKLAEIEAEKQRVLQQNDAPLWAIYVEKLGKITALLAETEGLKLNFCHAENRESATQLVLVLNEMRLNLGKIINRISQKR